MRQIEGPGGSSDTDQQRLESRASLALVDADAVWRLAAAMALRERGFRVDAYESVHALLSERHEQAPDVILVDAAASQADMHALCECLRDGARLAHCALLLLTGLEVDAVVERACNGLVVDFFIKSTCWVALATRLGHLLRLAKLQGELMASQDRLARLHDSSRVGSFDFDLDERVFRGSAGSFSIVGFEQPRASITETEFLLRVADSHRAELRRRAQAAIADDQPFVMDLPIRTVAGQFLMVRVEADPQRNGAGRVSMLRGVIRDITESLRAEARIEQLISADALTGLPNRNRFMALCAEAIHTAGERGTQVAIIALDLDRFTRVNESLGQVAGDEALCLIGERLGHDLALNWSQLPDVAEVRAPVLARLTGDEFAILLPRVRGMAAAERLLDALIAGFRRPFRVAGAECFVSCCAGVALYPGDGDSAGLLLSRADIALAAAKLQGSQTVNWYGSLSHAGTSASSRLAMLGALHKALERAEFELHYQPCIDAAHATPIGVEALVRWRRDGILVPPLEFIELAEESGLIVPIGEWAIRQACADMRVWHDAGLLIPQVSVNIPTLHFERPSLADTVREAVRTHDLAPGMLAIELTESCTVRDFDRTLGALHALRELGVELSLDDFGTGYSSLSYLTRLPIHRLKVDRSFVRMLGVSQEGEAVVRAIVALGRSLRLHLVAEGVETLAQARALLEMGCRDMQGFLFAPAVPAHALATVIERVRAAGPVTLPGVNSAGTPERAVILSGALS